MSDTTTRRAFLGRTAAASGCLAAHGLGRALLAAEEPAMLESVCGPRQKTGQRASSGAARGRLTAPVLVVTQSVSPDRRARARTWIYILEILKRAGLFFEHATPEQLSSLSQNMHRLVVLAGDLMLTTAQRDRLAHFVKAGGAVVGIGGTSGLEAVFGVSGRRPLAEGWIKVTASQHPLTSGFRSSLHVFGGYAVTAGSAQVLAELQVGRQGARGSAITVNRFGQGTAVLLGPDLIFSVVHIQQGLPVFQDGPPSPDGSAPLNDGELKAEDGLVLDWQQDRTALSPESIPVFLESVSDELRELILRSIFYAAREHGCRLPLVWLWPGEWKAVGHISHDTDGNDPDKAVALLEVMNRCGVKSTWCTLYPGGYPRPFYRTLQAQGFEVALHYDARTGGEKTSWSIENLVLQHRWLMKEAGLRHVTSNKNHYTRWEGRLDFFRWCEQISIEVDQTRGPSKKGTVGFPL
ncbi:MAG TPA: hypothetical protein EYP14_00285, partial [Planctomycetaceae bacterium]|nr:hypothetical protein [Planctomycetaceae bacterium]